MTCMKIVQFSRPPTPNHLSSKFFHPLDTGCFQLKENIIQGRLLYVIRSFLQVGFCFQYQPINLLFIQLKPHY